jgi:hypothetical protein
MKRAIFSLAALAALSLAACGGGGDPAPAGQAPGSTPGQAPPADPNAAPPPATGTVPPAEGAPAGTAATEDPMTPTGGYGGGEKMQYEVCMTQARQAGGDIGKQIETACKRLPDAPK